MQKLDAEILETLLQGEEGTTLDHKSEQYKFIGAIEGEKAELLKDILAMANAWKTSDAHIVVGAKENPGGRAFVQGVSEHIDDAKLQQFVNAKTNVPVTFSYEAVTVDGMMLGVFTIAKDQQRPVWLKKDFGSLQSLAVYLRRGSSTAVADPDEIARMGEARARHGQVASQLQLGIGNSAGASDPGTTFEIVSSLLEPPPPMPPVLRNHISLVEQFTARNLFGPPELVFTWRKGLALFQPVAVHVRNAGQTVASDARVELTVAKKAGLRLVDEEGLPAQPRGLADTMRVPSFRPSVHDTHVKDYEDHWVVMLRIGKVQPGGATWSAPFYLGSEAPMAVIIEARVLADEIPVPLVSTLSVTITTKAATYMDKSNDE